MLKFESKWKSKVKSIMWILQIVSIVVIQYLIVSYSVVLKKYSMNLLFIIICVWKQFWSSNEQEDCYHFVIQVSFHRFSLICILLNWGWKVQLRPSFLLETSFWWRKLLWLQYHYEQPLKVLAPLHEWH